MRAHWLWLAGLAALGAALAGCGGGEEAPPPNPMPVATVATPAPTPTTAARAVAGAPMATPTATATPVPTPTPPPPLTLAECKRVLALGDRFGEEPPTAGPCLIVVSDGTPDALMLEWAGGPENTTKWQYRLAIWTPESHPNPPWGEWGDIPSSGPATRAYRLTGLTKASRYRVQIRGITGTADAAPSNTYSGATHLPAPHFPSLFVLNIVEGDGETRWRIGDNGYAVVFPKGMRLRLGTWAMGNAAFYAPLYDVLSGSAIGLESTYDSGGRLATAFTGARDIVMPTASTATTAPPRDVNALFDQIEASLRRVPLASEIEAALVRFRSDQGQAPTSSLKPVTLTTVAPPDAGALILEWTGTPSSVTKWQYRLRGPIWQGAGGKAWSEWRDIPGSDANTRSYRLGGLAQFRQYFFQVRGWPALAEGAASNAASATTLRFESDGFPHMPPGQVVEGGATYRIGGLDYVTAVPENMRLMMGGATHNSDGSVTVSLFDVATGSYLLIDSETGEYVERTIAGEGNAPRVNALFDQIVASIRLVPRPPEPATTPTPTLTCTQATLGVDPATNAGLARDCDTLLTVKATLAGTGTLNWSADTHIGSWDGVTVSGTPERVTALSLASRGLAGAVPAGLGNLQELRGLRLEGNQLSGRIPSKLGQLTGLGQVYVNGNQLTGCAPPAWEAVADKNLGGLAYCDEPLDAWDHETLTGGNTYRFQRNSRVLPLIIDIPDGEKFTWTSESVDVSEGPVSILIIEHVTSSSDIVLSWRTGKESDRIEDDTGTSTASRLSIGAVLDQIAASVWIAELP